MGWHKHRNGGKKQIGATANDKKNCNVSLPGSYGTAQAGSAVKTTEIVTKVKPDSKPVCTDWPRGIRNQLRWSPYAWAKLKWFCARGGTEVGGFGVTAVDDLLYVEDFRTVKQTASVAKFDFDDEALNDYMSSMADAGIPPNRCMRVWVHTHPGGLDRPSATDEEVFTRVGTGAHNIMFILTEDGKTYGELRLRTANMDASRKLSTAVEFRGAFAGVTPGDIANWEQEYCDTIMEECVTVGHTRGKYGYTGNYYCDLDEEEDMAWRRAWYKDDKHGADGFNDGADDDTTPWDYGDDSHNITFEEDVVRLVIKDEKMDVPQWVYTNKYWFRFGGAAIIYATIGEKVKSAADMASYMPRAWGEVEWKPDPREKDVEIGELLSVSVPQLGFIACSEDGEPLDDALLAAKCDVEIARDEVETIAEKKALEQP